MFKKNITTKKILLTILFTLLTILIGIDARNRKPKEKKQKKIYNPRDKKPLRISDELYCQICKDVVRETAKSLFNKKRDYEVIEAIENTCKLPNMYTNGKEIIKYILLFYLKKF